MNPATHNLTWFVFGQTEQRISEVAERFQGGGSQISGTQVVVFLVIVVIISIVLWRVARVVALRDGRSYFSSKRLFLDLCRLHELDLASRRLLRRLAHARELEHPAKLFLEPGAFDPAQIPPALRSCQSQLNDIKHRLFHADGEPADAKSM